MALRNFFNSLEPHFQKDGKYKKFYPIFEMVETIFFTSNTVTKAAPHARSFVDMKRRWKVYSKEKTPDIAHLGMK